MTPDHATPVDFEPIRLTPEDLTPPEPANPGPRLGISPLRTALVYINLYESHRRYLEAILHCYTE